MKKIVGIMLIGICLYCSEPKNITFECSSKNRTKRLELSLDCVPLLRQSEVLDALLTNVVGDSNPIPLQVRRKVFKKILLLLDTKQNIQQQCFEKSCKKYLTPLTDQQLAEVANTADYLNVPHVLQETVSRIAQRLQPDHFVKDPRYIGKLGLKKPVTQVVAQALLSLPAAGETLEAMLLRIEAPVKILDSRKFNYLSELSRRMWGVCIQSIACNADDILLVTLASHDDAIRIWSVNTGTLKYILKKPSVEQLISSVEVSPDNTLVAVGSNDGITYILDVKTGVLKHIFEGPIKWHSGSVFSMAFSPDNNYLATGSYEEARIWDVNTGTLKRTFGGHTGRVVSVSLSSNGSLLATGSMDEIARIWDVSSGELKYSLKGHSGSIFSVAFSPDNNYLATGSNDRTVLIWDVRKGIHVRTLKAHADDINVVAFSPDGKWLATGSDDKTTCISDVRTGALIHKREHADWVKLVAFSTDGTRLATLSGGSWHQMTYIGDLRSLLQAYNQIKNLSLKQVLLLMAAYDAHKSRHTINVDKYPHLKAIYDSLDLGILKMVKSWFDQ